MIVSTVYIVDEPDVRYTQLVEVVLTHCATVLWPTRPRRVARARLQAEHLRATLHQRCPAAAYDAMRGNGSGGGDVPSASSSSTSSSTMHAMTATTTATPPPPPLPASKRKTPHKHGQNGLSVASVDTIRCSNKTNRSNNNNNNNNGACRASHTVVPSCTTHGGHCHGANGYADGASAVAPVGTDDGNTDAVVAKAAPTPATTRSGDVILVSETGSPLLESALTSSQLPLHVRRMSGGITNELFHIFADDDDDEDEDVDDDDDEDDDDGEGEGEGGCVNNGQGNEGDAHNHHPLSPVAETRSEARQRRRRRAMPAASATTSSRSPSVVVRVFGKETERVISRESELFYQSLFLRTYVHGVNFLVYEFLPEHIVLPYTDMPCQAAAIADVLAAFQVHATLAARHDVVHATAGVAATTSSSTATATATANPTRDAYTRYDREENYTLQSLTVWVEQATSAAIVANVHPDKRDGFVRLGHQLAAECAWMCAVLRRPSLSSALGEGVCHNDLLSANIMRHTTTGALTIIDFDYTKRNYLLFDVANHFNEYTGLECDYARYFPSDAHMGVFLTHYRRAMRRHLVHVHGQQEQPQQQQQPPQQQQQPEGRHEQERCMLNVEAVARARNGVERNGESNVDDDDDDEAAAAVLWSSYDAHCHGDEVFAHERALFWSGSVDEECAVVLRWTRLVKLLTLASHLSWSVWSLLQEAVSALDVDFLSYAELRYARYASTKAEYARDVY